jgi:ATP-dependent DNA helicase RecQ
MIERHQAQSALGDWGRGTGLSITSRLDAALATTKPTSRTGAADIAVLLRQCLRGDDERRRAADLGGSTGWVPSWLEVPVCTLFPESFDWSVYGLLPQSNTDRGVRISAEPWRPPWLESSGDTPPVDADSAAAVLCRVDESVRGDPFLPTVDSSIRRYKTPGQRAAVRSAMVLPPGATLVVNLPTGAGKTLAMLAAAESASPGMTAVVVVPTVALALDHARRYEAQHPGSPSAYYGDLSESAKRAFRDRLRVGEQRLIFTNPEAVVSALARPLAETARGGRLALLAVDEAHVVGSWGDAFRPHFHSLAGFRTYLLREVSRVGHAPFKTILASATLSEDTLVLLRTLFGEPGPFLQVAAPVVRPEPSFWQTTGLESRLRDARLLEALRHLPRPAIVYTTLRQERAAPPGALTPERVARLLRAADFRRLATVDGGSSAAHRERVLRGLRNESATPAVFDVVVATAAFGLGIDIPDIRTVIHACVPESIDRFYQEVGRGGRDGRAATSLVVATRHDEDVADNLASPSYLTSQRARERWAAMMAAAHATGDGLHRLPLTATPPDVPFNSEYNERWNLFTVILLARAGAVRWDFSFAGLDSDGQPASDSGWLTVRLVRGDHQSDQFWTDVAEATRQSMVDRSGLGLANLRQAMRGDACTGALIAESYRISRPPDLRAGCMPACGGCRWCRTHGRKRWASASPTPAAIAAARDDRVPLDRLAVAGRYGRRVAICIDPATYSRPRQLRNLIKHLVPAGGIGLIVAGDEVLETVRGAVAGSQALTQVVMVDSIDEFDPLTTVGTSTLVFLPATADPADWLDGNGRSPLTVVCGTSDLPVADGSLTLNDQDGSYPLTAIERLLS